MVTAWKAEALADLLAPRWDLASFQIRTVIGSGDQQYLLLLPKLAGGRESLLVVLSEDGSLERVQVLPAHLEPTFGIDPAGNVTLLRTVDWKHGLVQTYSPDGKMPREVAVSGSGVLVSEGSALRVFRRGSYGSVLTPDGTQSAKEITHTIPALNGPYAVATLADGKSVVLNLSDAALTVIGSDGRPSPPQKVDKNVLSRYGSHVESHESNIFYPDLTNPIVSSGGHLWASVNGVQAKLGSVAVRLNPETAEVEAAVRFELPTHEQLKTRGNPEGYLVPSGWAVCDNYVTLFDTGSGRFAIYKIQF